MVPTEDGEVILVPSDDEDSADEEVREMFRGNVNKSHVISAEHARKSASVVVTDTWSPAPQKHRQPLRVKKEENVTSSRDNQIQPIVIEPENCRVFMASHLMNSQDSHN